MAAGLGNQERQARCFVPLTLHSARGISMFRTLQASTSSLKQTSPLYRRLNRQPFNIKQPSYNPAYQQLRHCSSTSKSTAAIEENDDMTREHVETSHARIFENNKKWVESMKASDPKYFEKLSSGQIPDYLYIGCADSRVPANEIMGLGAGEVFTTRNIANLVPNTDLSVMAVINYAVRHLKVKHIVVCGHYGCGGVLAAMTPADLGILNPWLRNIRDVYRLHEAELDAIPKGEERYRRLVELNVVEQCRNVIKTAAVQQSYEANGFPIVHGWVFDLHDGLLKDLDVNFEEMLKGIKKLYNLGAELETEPQGAAVEGEPDAKRTRSD